MEVAERRDKVKELAEKLEISARNDWAALPFQPHFEAILRAELKPLLEKAERATISSERARDELYAELQLWQGKEQKG